MLGPTWHPDLAAARVCELVCSIVRAHDVARELLVHYDFVVAAVGRRGVQLADLGAFILNREVVSLYLILVHI